MLRDQAMLESFRSSGRYKIERIIEEDAKSLERKHNAMSMLTQANNENNEQYNEKYTEGPL